MVSTIFKQFSLRFSTWALEDKQSYLKIIRENLRRSFDNMFHEILSLGQVDDTIQSSISYVQKMPDNDTKWDSNAAIHMSKLWADPVIQSIYHQTSHLLADDFAYFVLKVHAIGSPDYKVSDEDILHVRVRTTGVLGTRFNIGDKCVSMWEMGGNRNKRNNREC